MAENKAESKAQTTAKELRQLSETLRQMNEVIIHVADDETQTREQVLARVRKQLLERINEALRISERFGSEGPPYVLTTALEVKEGAAELTKISELLRLRHSETLLDMHLQLNEGLAVRSVEHLIENLSAIPKGEALAALGVSSRTIERRGKTPRKPLSREQSGRIFKFAEVLAKATDVFGSQEAAEAWLSRPATGLNRQRPIDLLATPAGVELVERFLTRLDYGVYT
jgi:putative toxin-antitoxin system antitoxin component (TIGR02293 family)